MKILLAILALVVLSSCTDKTEFGPCIGAFDDKRPDLVYKASANNIFWGIVGWEIIAPPVIVLLEQTYCPVGRY